MDFSDSTKIVFNRIRKLEPEHVTKIIGYLLLQDHGDQEMVQLALSPDIVIQELIYKAKAELQQLPLKSASAPISPSMNSPPVSDGPFQYTPFSPVSSRPAMSLPASFRVPSYWENHVVAKHNSDFVPLGYSDSINELQNQAQFLSLEDQMEHVNFGNTGFANDYYYSDAVLSNLGARSRRYTSPTEIPVKTCHYYNKGFCKHGSNCRYYHGQVSENYSQLFVHNSMDGFNEDHVFSPGSLEKLELEIVELLKSKRGNPISIASLPMIYYEKYGKVLQADGYLTESQRHGKAGYSLTKLLARLKNSIRLIDRPHGQHAVILAEDAPKYLESRNERSDPGPIVCGSRQIYLTFPAESTFSEDDVSNYFSTYGEVEDVRIPCQQKRMFGFVTFASADTVKIILAKGNPHFVCGARVLVKPYREKSKLVDRKYQERMEPSIYFSPPYIDMDSELQSYSRGCETSRFLRKQQLMEEHEQALEFERRHLAELQLVQKPLASQPYFGYSMDGLKVSEDHLNFPSAERFSYLLDVLNNGSAADGVKHAENNYTDQESSEGLNLPDSPFASPIASGISTVI
ncbi:zinc finger CCCH domain-containing protein 18-like isoform X1 [Pistacia vera]|uniref:zinc finger CCCH domain-containing protein 18-like isoform X1 n=1 Tax=Pistacia vera TaxID=55513 RepID=UPI0012634679|nr:zinc finger CCCH domain-containing protein 18-like isoform X1 [Pistacia vera]XP_031253344.1 zinc finger CCCH domain-containing protein 18-like isoform X1 [Pistacia vera]